jgi:MarR-like DNA-binding transcriptional regulator SgrR of sgrS sRNA
MQRIFVVAAILIPTTLSIFFATRNSNMTRGNKSIRVVLQGSFPAGTLAPENISTIALYHLHSNLWDTLVQTNGEPGIAKTYAVSEDNLIFVFDIDPAAKFSNGRRIYPSDVKFAIDRIISHEENGHINARSMIRDVTLLQSERIQITLNAPTPSFLFLLGTPEFAIVPKEALDASGAVINLTITSGAYLATRVDVLAQTIVLNKNKEFPRSVAGSPDQVEISFKENTGPIVEGDYDFAEIRSSDANQIVSNAEQHGYSYKATVPSLSVFLIANSNRIKPPLQKLFARAFANEFHFESPRGLETRSRQLLPPKTFGSLNETELPTLSENKGIKVPAEVVISNNRSSGPLVDAIQASLAKVGTRARFVDLASKEPVDYVLDSQGMNTEFPEIELHLAAVGPYQYFDSSNEVKQLIGLATHQPDDTKRSAMIKQIGIDLLSSGKIVPLTVRAYAHLFKPGQLDLNGITNYDGEIPFYKMKALP